MTETEVLYLAIGSGMILLMFVGTILFELGGSVPEQTRPDVVTIESDGNMTVSCSARIISICEPAENGSKCHLEQVLKCR